MARWHKFDRNNPSKDKGPTASARITTQFPWLEQPVYLTRYLCQKSLTSPPKRYNRNLPSGHRVVTKNQPIIQEIPKLLENIRKLTRFTMIWIQRFPRNATVDLITPTITSFSKFSHFSSPSLCHFSSLSLNRVCYKTNSLLFIQLMLRKIILITECLIYS